MITRQELAHYLQDTLQVSRYNDYAPNGLQVEGKEELRRICTAVTASSEVITAAIAMQADALLVHHGYFWRGESAVITGMKRERLSLLLNHSINLFAYHLPLDCHLELGNNACLAKLFVLMDIKTHAVNGIEHLLWSGQFAAAKSGEELRTFLAAALQRQPLHIIGHQRPITSIAWCSGGAQDYIEIASQLGVDAYISGEVSERTYYQAKELGIDYYACGHHATERYGIQTLGEFLAQSFELEHFFLDAKNPI